MHNIKLALCILFVTITAQADLLPTAKKEGWTFHFVEKSKPYSTGFVKRDMVETMPHVAFEEPTPIPEAYDLRAKVSPIENQGNCGSCWSFSLVATLRDALATTGRDPGRLSQQYLVDCDRRQYGCGGGYFNAADMLVAPKGSPDRALYPYTARNGRCKASKPIASIASWSYVGASGRAPNVEEIQRAVLKYGPVSVTVGADSRFMSYESGVYNACTNQSTNHMVNIVGWDNREQYWIMRNSWGVGWGEDGFMRIKFKGKSGRLCNRIGEQAVFVQVADAPAP